MRSRSGGDGVVLRGHLGPGQATGRSGGVVINTATGVLARYYHPYARFLAPAAAMC